jgi:hypothetical protein
VPGGKTVPLGKGVRNIVRKAVGGGGGKAKPSAVHRVESACANSFVAGTPVMMADGSFKPIEAVRVGDRVLALDERTGLTGSFPVIGLLSTAGSKQLVRLTTGAGVITVTANHPFKVAGQSGWTNASDLHLGDRLLSANSGVLSITRVERFSSAARRVFNFTVGTAHTYYAGAGGALVHNQGSCRSAVRAPALGSGNAYSVGFRSRLPQASYPGRSRAHHYQEANRDLLKTLDQDPAFAARMEDMIPVLRSQLRGAGGAVSRRPPEGWTWHHAAEEGVMELVPRIQHRAPGHLRELLHPGGRGGFSTWGTP